VPHHAQIVLGRSPDRSSSQQVRPLADISRIVSYALARTADRGFSVTVCQDKRCDESVRVARDWIAKNAGNTGASAPTISEGTVFLHLK
jgi:hypothetical protein